LDGGSSGAGERIVEAASDTAGGLLPAVSEPGGAS
jgi:hypothetical protein